MGGHVKTNRRFWDENARRYQARHGERLGETARAWGVWRIPESEIEALGDLRGRRVLELGCGAAQWAAALAEDGAVPVGLDLSENQLEAARGYLRDRGLRVPLVQGNAEELPLQDACLDAVVCDHGALSFADPHAAIPEIARVLRPGGVLAFSIHSPLLFMCWNPGTERLDERLHWDYFRMRSTEGETSIQFQLPYAEWLDLFRDNALDVERLIHLRPPEGAKTTYDDFAPYEWARRWPAEDLWVVRKRR